MTRRAPRTGWTRAAIAAAMAYAFVLQLVLLSVGGAFHAAAAAEAQGDHLSAGWLLRPGPWAEEGPRKSLLHRELSWRGSGRAGAVTPPSSSGSRRLRLPPTFPAMRPTYASHPLSCLWDRARRRASAELPTIDSNLFCQDSFP